MAALISASASNSIGYSPYYIYHRGAEMEEKNYKKFSVDEIEKLPMWHNARKDSNLLVCRTKVANLDLSSFCIQDDMMKEIFE